MNTTNRKFSPVVFWLFGLSGAGKTTIASGVEKRLVMANHSVVVLDGDALRKGINADLGFSLDDRFENIRRMAEIARICSQAGLITIVSAISPTQNIRDMAKEIIGHDVFVPVFIKAPIEICIQRDPKGLYRKAISGEITEFTGVSSPFDIPMDETFSISTENITEQETIDVFYQFVINRTFEPETQRRDL
jgi:adenylyl-sulfate kinase